MEITGGKRRRDRRKRQEHAEGAGEMEGKTQKGQEKERETQKGQEKERERDVKKGRRAREKRSDVRGCIWRWGSVPGRGGAAPMKLSVVVEVVPMVVEVVPQTDQYFCSSLTCRHTFIPGDGGL